MTAPTMPQLRPQQAQAVEDGLVDWHVLLAALEAVRGQQTSTARLTPVTYRVVEIGRMAEEATMDRAGVDWQRVLLYLLLSGYVAAFWYGAWRLIGGAL